VIRTFIGNRSRFAVTEAVDGSEALQKAAVLKPDLIVLDLSMPTANGVEVAALLRSRTPRTPVVILQDGQKSRLLPSIFGHFCGCCCRNVRALLSLCMPSMS